MTIGVPLDTTQVRRSMEQYFGDADVTFVVIESPAAFFEGARPDVDAFLMPAEGAAASTLLHPRYTVVVPQPDPVGIPFAFGLAGDAEELRVLVDAWVCYAREAGVVDEAYDYWVLGRGAEATGHRWSILRNVIGWGRTSG